MWTRGVNFTSKTGQTILIFRLFLRVNQVQLMVFLLTLRTWLSKQYTEYKLRSQDSVCFLSYIYLLCIRSAYMVLDYIMFVVARFTWRINLFPTIFKLSINFICLFPWIKNKWNSIRAEPFIIVRGGGGVSFKIEKKGKWNWLKEKKGSTPSSERKKEKCLLAGGKK